jgi:hypothetical protein
MTTPLYINMHYKEIKTETMVNAATVVGFCISHQDMLVGVRCFDIQLESFVVKE